MNLGHGGHLTHGNPGQLLRASSIKFVQYGVPQGHRPHRLRRARRRRASASTTRDDHRRRQRLLARHRLRPHGRDRPLASAPSSSPTWPTSPASSPPASIPSPVPHADFVTTTTHKTLRGPRGGLIALQGRAHAKADRLGRVPRRRRAARSCTSSPPRPCASASASSPSSRPTARTGREQRPRPRRGASTAARLQDSSPAAPTTTSCSSICARNLPELTGKKRPGDARSRRHHLQQEHRPLRRRGRRSRASGHPPRHARRHHARPPRSRHG